MKISVCILTKNSEKTIKKTLQSVETFDEIIIIDDNSSDNTLKIASKYTKNIYKHKLEYNFAAQRNFALSKATNKFVLFIDSDEYLSEKLIKEIENLKSNSNIDGYKITRQEIWMGKMLVGGEWGKIKLVRLGRKNQKWKRSVHEYWDINNISSLNNRIIHEPKNSIADLIAKINNYSQLHARENESENKSSNILIIIFKPILKFKYNFFAKLGFRDGTHGFIYAILMSFHSFLSWSSLWLSQKK